ncbi:hypothetical protein T265_10502 [Opisthorchis viverrini]|uniref:Uncharacterized protein n=1 Tax=Opisthorchis viverrini TaxID=6198 RepID=A0A074Z6A1_OPIVI|nr:hypothetical protein T265_10502 [Opisthorchis viverrini]KER21087.1 hypothetical protein T265_10502 [Opisthorchis viverrini]
MDKKNKKLDRANTSEKYLSRNGVGRPTYRGGGRRDEVLQNRFQMSFFYTELLDNILGPAYWPNDETIYLEMKGTRLTP